MGNQKDLVMQLAEEYVKDYRKANFGALKDWTEIDAESFSRVPIETLIRDPYFLGLKDKVYDGVLEDILDLFEERRRRQVNLAIFLEGIGSGKTVKASIINWLLWFELTLCVPSPQEYFDLAPLSVIALINMNRCISGDSLIISNQGIKRIDNLVNDTNNLFLSSLKGKEKVISGHKNGKKLVKTLILRNGFKITGTEDHLIRVKDNFIKLGELEIGDSVLCQYNQQMFGNNTLIDKELAYVLGVLIGDGQLGHKRGYIKWCSLRTESEHSEYCKKIINDRFSDGYDMVSKKDYNDRNVSIYSVQYSARKKFRKLLNELGLNTKAHFKKVPTCILESPKETQIQFIRGLFDTDGSVTKGRPKVKFTSVSYQLINEVQLMLNNLGIISTVRKRYRHSWVWTIYILGIQAKKYYDEIGFYIKRKQEILEDSLNNHEFHNFLEWVDDRHWLEEIKEIEYGESETYDFSMDNELNFCANGIMIHNSEKQAKRVTFAETFPRFQCPFNQDYFPSSDKYTSEIRIPRNNTTIFPGTSSALSALGYNLYGGTIDEAAFLEVIDDSTKTYDGKFDAAEEMYHAIMNRMVSRFLRKGHLPGLLCMISSPNFPDDFLHKQIEYAKKLEEEAKKLKQPNRSGVFWRRRPTWEAKGKKFYPENEYFYIDTENGEILEDPQVKHFLDHVKEELFPLKIDPDVLIQVAQFIKKEKDYARPYSS